MYVAVLCFVGCVMSCHGNFAAVATEENAYLANMFDLMTKRLDEMDQKFSGLIKEESTKLQDITMAMDKMDFRISQLNEDMKHMKTGRLEKDMFLVQDPFISFTAYATEYRDYDNGHQVLFDGTIRNYGNLYNPETSVFTCEYTGYYLFSINILSRPGFVAEGIIMLNGEELVRSYSDIVNNTTYVQGSNMVVTLCEQNSQVYVVSGYDGARFYGNVDYKFTTFVGTLLHHITS